MQIKGESCTKRFTKKLSQLLAPILKNGYSLTLQCLQLKNGTGIVRMSVSEQDVRNRILTVPGPFCTGQCTPRTNKVRPWTLGPTRHGPPHQSLPDIPGQTKADLERAALRATVLRTSLSPTSPDKQSTTSSARPCAPRSSAPASPRHPRTNKVRPRMLGAARLARTRVPNISPLTRGNNRQGRHQFKFTSLNCVFLVLSSVFSVHVYPDCIALLQFSH